MRPTIVNVADFANLSLLPAGHALREKLAGAVVVASDEVPADVVTMQSCVMLGNEAGETRLVSIVYPGEADDERGRVSVLGSLGSALFGARVGDAIDCEERGARRLRVEQIVYQPEHSMRTHLVLREY